MWGGGEGVVVEWRNLAVQKQWERTVGNFSGVVEVHFYYREGTNFYKARVIIIGILPPPSPRPPPIKVVHHHNCILWSCEGLPYFRIASTSATNMFREVFTYIRVN